MLDFLKKLIISNKYSLLVLLILSLWLRLAKDYSIILSYIVLIILYLIIGMIVGFVLELLQQNKKEKEYSEEETRPFRRSAVTKPSQTVPQEKKREVSSNHDAIRNHSAGTRTVRVTSSYIKSADGMSGSMSRRLEKTAATFKSIKQDSDKYAEEEKKFSTLYGNTQKSLFENPEDLYTNKKSEKENKTLNNSFDDIPEKKEVVKEVASFETSEFDDFSDFSASTKDSDSEIDEISKEINERISQNTSTRHRKISLPKEISFVPKDNIRPAKPAAMPKSSPVTTSRPTNKVQEESVKQKPVFETRVAEKPRVPSRNTHVVNDEPDDKVNADMAKLDRLFNHSRDNDDRTEKNQKNGLFSAFKKKRRAKRDKNS